MRRYPKRETRRPAAPYFAVSPLIDTAFVRPRATLAGASAIRQLAEDMRQGAHREGGVSADDLELLGWTPAQLGAHAADARVLAQSLSGMGA